MFLLAFHSNNFTLQIKLVFDYDLQICSSSFFFDLFSNIYFRKYFRRNNTEEFVTLYFNIEYSHFLALCLIASIEAYRNCLEERYFTSQGRGIGYSFQLAITAPLYSITGYCIATAQS